MRRFLPLAAVSLIAASCGSTSRIAPTAAAQPAVTTSAASTPTLASTFTTVADDALYLPPNPLPAGRAGDIIQITAPVVVAGGAAQYKVLYRSTSVDGTPIAVSGLVTVPRDVAPDAPVLSYAHGTSGLGDACPPSKDQHQDEPPREANAFVGSGYILASTDYEGLGTPGVHPYAVGRSEGAAVLDAIRAARQLTATHGKAVVWGHSQGGGASLWAAQLAPSYAPDANVVGAVAGAPAVELKLLAGALGTSPFFGYLFMAAAGFRAAYPDVDLSALFTPAGLEAVTTAERSCWDFVLTMRGKPAGDYLKADLATTEPLASHLEDNSPGNIATDVPIFVYHGTEDEQIPVDASLLFLARACRVGGFTVVRKTYPGADHGSVIPTAVADIERFMADRLAGAAVTPTPCPTS